MELLQESGEQSHGHEDAVTAQSAAARELIEEVSPRRKPNGVQL
jgi:hypothetical protein